MGARTCSVHHLGDVHMLSAAREHLDVRLRHRRCRSRLSYHPAPVHLLRIRFYAKGVNCCAEIRSIMNSGPDGGNCPPAGPCRGFEGDCGDIPAQFADIPILPAYPDGLADYTCEAFPNEDAPIDSFLVGLIASACLRRRLRAFSPIAAQHKPLPDGHTHLSRIPLPIVAVALPVTLVLSSSFEMANDSEVRWPACWLPCIGGSRSEQC